MIYIERKITIKKNQAKIEQPIVLYKGDANIKLKFSIENNPFKHASGVDALYGRLVIKRPNANPIFSEPVKMSESRVIFTVTGDMIDGLDAEGNPSDELGAYDFQIQLLNSESISEETSIGSLPEVTGGIIIKKPLCEGASANVARINDSYVMPGNDNISTFSLRDSNNAFDEDGNYIKTNWAGGDIITDTRLNKVETALYEINDNIITTYASRDFVDDMIDANNNALDDKYLQSTALNDYVTKDYITDSLEDYATQDYVAGIIETTQEYVDEAISNIEIPEGDNLPIRVIGNGPDAEPYIFTGNEFTDEEWDRGGHYAVLFNNTMINDWNISGLCDVYLAARGTIYIWSPRLGFHEYWKDADIWVESYSYQYATTSELEDIRERANNSVTYDQLNSRLNNQFDSYATKEYVGNAIANIKIPEGGGDCVINTIGYITFTSIDQMQEDMPTGLYLCDWDTFINYDSTYLKLGNKLICVRYYEKPDASDEGVINYAEIISYDDFITYTFYQDGSIIRLEKKTTSPADCATKEELQTALGDIGSILDDLNGEVIE